MDLIVKYAIENVCQDKVNYDTSLGYFNLNSKNTADVLLDEADVEWILNEIEYMSTLKFDEKRRATIMNNIKNKKITVAEFIRDMETQSSLVRSERMAQRNSSGKPISLKELKKSLLDIKLDEPRCLLTEEKCDKIPANKKVDFEKVCKNSNCKIAKNFFDFVERMR